MLTLLFDGLTTVFLGVFLAIVGPQLVRAFRVVDGEKQVARP